jgi:zinc/manganese transport system permease protein
VLGLLTAYNFDLPAGPAVVLTAGAAWIVGLTVGPRASLLRPASRIV